jgi:hypothetical protein
MIPFNSSINLNLMCWTKGTKLNIVVNTVPLSTGLPPVFTCRQSSDPQEPADPVGLVRSALPQAGREEGTPVGHSQWMRSLKDQRAQKSTISLWPVLLGEMPCEICLGRRYHEITALPRQNSR